MTEVKRNTDALEAMGVDPDEAVREMERGESPFMRNVS